MKKRIVELLEKRGYSNKKNELVYHIQEGDKLITKRKKISEEFKNYMIEEKWQDCRLPLNITSIVSKNIGITRVVKRKEEIDEAKQWVFECILVGILTHEAKPKGSVCIWVEECEENIKVCGLCETV